MLNLTYHAKKRLEKRDIPLTSIYGALRSAKPRVQHDGERVYLWQGLKVVVGDDDAIITVHDRLK